MVKDYQETLQPETEATFDATPKQMADILAKLGRKWIDIFAKAAERMAESLVGQVDRYSRSSVNASLAKASEGVSIGALKRTPNVNRAISAAAVNNAALIKSLADEYHDRVSKSVLGSVAAGGKGSKQVFEDIKAIGKVTDRRAKLIAIDQTRKITSAINTARMEDAGITQFEWVHSRGSTEPRQLHLDYDGKVFSIADPPVIDDRTGERGMPGQLINCRCVAIPIIA